MTLKEYLQINDITLDEFGALVGTSRQAVHNWVQGRQIPHKDFMGRIAEATNHAVRADDFYGLPEKPNGGPRPREGTAA